MSIPKETKKECCDHCKGIDLARNPVCAEGDNPCFCHKPEPKECKHENIESNMTPVHCADCGFIEEVHNEIQKEFKPEPKECEHKNLTACNRETCDGVEFKHELHCEKCHEPIQPEPKTREPATFLEELLDGVGCPIKGCGDEDCLRVAIEKLIARELSKQNQSTLDKVEEKLKKIAMYHTATYDGKDMATYSVKDVLDILKQKDEN